MRANHRRGPVWLASSTALVLLLAACNSGGPGAGTPSGNTTSSGGTSGYPTGGIQIMAPADPGGGWDSTARAMQPAVEEVTGANVEVYNVGGAGGTIGLAQLVDKNAGDPNQLMVMGLVMVGSIATNASAVNLTQITPIASLTAEQEAIVVPKDSKYQSLQDLVTAWKADPTSISWGGGSAGGTDHILVGLLAQAAGIDPSGINYVAHSGGGEAMNDILSGAVTAGVSGVSEFQDQVDAGALRYLAVSGSSAPEGVDAPTIKDAGFDVTLDNWRGVVAPPDISDADRQAIVQMITEMHDSAVWQKALKDNGWDDFFHTGDEFATYLGSEKTRVEAVLKEIGLTS